MNPLASDILEFWFGPRGGDPLARSAQWFKRDSAFDDEIRARFGATIESGARGEFDGWTKGDDDRDVAHASLALVILLDQFTRNVFRNSARAFATDEHALEISLRTQERGLDAKLTFIERYFLEMPMMHAESREVQRRSVTAFMRLVEEATNAGEPESIVKMLRSAHEYAVRHAEIVERFGRFPHRNTILGRTSTGDEIEFLRQPGSSF